MIICLTTQSSKCRLDGYFQRCRNDERAGEADFHIKGTDGWYFSRLQYVASVGSG